MRARVAKLLVCLSLLIPLQLTATPANAGQDYWSTDACRPDVWWYNQTGLYGTYYWRAETGTLFVGGERMAIYQSWGYQCGPLGAPTSSWNGWEQWFQEGVIYFNGTCMRVWHEVSGTSGCGGA